MSTEASESKEKVRKVFISLNVQFMIFSRTASSLIELTNYKSICYHQTAYLPPSNFAMVDKGVYRSSFPKKKNFPFLKKLGLKSVIFLCPEEYPTANLEFMDSIGAKLLQFGVQGNKVSFGRVLQPLI
jgi:hypothetical protein